MKSQMRSSLLAGVVMLCGWVNADIPGVFVVQEARIEDPTTNTGTLRQNFGYGGMDIIGDVNGDGVKDLIAGAPSNDFGSLVVVKLAPDGKSLGVPTVLSARDPLIAAKLETSRERWATGVAVAQQFSASNPCAVVVVNSGNFMKLWALKICKDGASVPYINAVNMIDSTGAALSGLNMTSIGVGHSIAVLDITATGKVILGVGNPLDGSGQGTYEGRVLILALEPSTLQFTRLAVYPESYGATDPLGKNLVAGEYFGNSIAPLRGVMGSRGMAVVSRRYSSAGANLGRIHLIRFDSDYKYSSSVVFDGAAPFTTAGAPISVATADFNHDGISDLLVGHSDDNGGGSVPIAKQGAVQIVYLDAAGKSIASKMIRKGAEGLVDSNGALGASAQFGMRVLVSDIDTDGQPDLIVGSQGNPTSSATPITGSIWNLRMKYPPLLLKGTGAITLQGVPVFVPLKNYVTGNQLRWTATAVNPTNPPLSVCTIQGTGGDAQLKCVSNGVNGVSNWTVVASDTGNVPASDHFEQTVNFTVTIVNQDSAPVLRKPLPKIVLREDQPDTAVLALYDYFRDPEMAPMSFPLTPLNGSTSNLLNYSLVGDTLHLSGVKFRHGTCSLQVVARDQGLASASDTLVVEIVHVNHAPTPLPDSYERYEAVDDTFDVLKNDSDPDGDALTITISVQPKHGKASVVAKGIRYQSSPFYLGADTLRYMVHDKEDSAEAYVAFKLSNTPGPAIVYKALRDTTVRESAPAVVISTDSLFFSGSNRFTIETYGPKYDCQGIATVDYSYANHKLTVTPLPYKWGRCQINLRAVTPDSLASAMYFTIEPIPTPYNFPKDTLFVDLQMGSTQYLILDSTDLDGDTIQYSSISSLPPWISIDRSRIALASTGEEAKLRITSRKKAVGGVDTNSVSDTLVVFARFSTASIGQRKLGSATMVFGARGQLGIRGGEHPFQVELIDLNGRILAIRQGAPRASIVIELPAQGKVSLLRLIEGGRTFISPLQILP